MSSVALGLLLFYSVGSTATEVKSVAVLPLKSKGTADKKVVEVLDDLILLNLQKMIGAKTRVVGRADIEAVLGLDRQRTALGCDEASCAVELAGALGVDSLIYGSLGALGKKYIVTLTWLRQKSGEVIAREGETLGSDQNDFDDGIRRAVAKLVGAEPPVAVPQSSPSLTTAQPPSSSAVGANTAVEWVPQPGGAFTYGCVPGDAKCQDDEQPARREKVSAFSLMKTEVTVAAYEQCATAGACSRHVQTLDVPKKTCNWKNGRANHPINCLDWDQAKSFCAWVGGRLPTAIEWEYAAKSGSEVVYPWGNAPVSGRRANYCDAHCLEAVPEPDKWRSNGWVDFGQNDGYGGTAPVGSYDSGVSPRGLLDMAGNVFEWTASDYDSLRKEARGGSFLTGPLHLRASNRLKLAAATWRSDLGLRCAK